MRGQWFLRSLSHRVSIVPNPCEMLLIRRNYIDTASVCKQLSIRQHPCAACRMVPSYECTRLAGFARECELMAAQVTSQARYGRGRDSQQGENPKVGAKKAMSCTAMNG